MRFWILVLFLLHSIFTFAADKYFCPMHCEGKKTYEKPGTCPVCQMYLEKEPEPGAESGPLSSKDYRLDLTSREAQNQKGYVLEIELTPRSTQNNEILKNLEQKSETDFELYFTDQNLSFMDTGAFRTMNDGKLRVLRRFEKSGNYLVFAIFKPKGIREQVFPLALKVDVPKEKAGERDPILRIPSKNQYGYYVIISEDTTFFHREHTKIKKNIPINEIKKILPKPGNYKLFIQDVESGSLKRIDLKK